MKLLSTFLLTLSAGLFLASCSTVPTGNTIETAPPPDEEYAPVELRGIYLPTPVH